MEQGQSLLKNAKIFSVNIENFDENINEGKIERTLGVVGGCYWKLRIDAFWENGVNYLSIETRPESHNSFLYSRAEKFSIEMTICVKNETLEKWEKYQGRFEVKRYEWSGWWTFLRMDTILDPNSGFLSNDGALTMQLEIRVDYLIDRFGKRLINTLDPFEGSVLFEVDSNNFYVSKQMLMLHSPVLAKQLADGCDKVRTPNHIPGESGHVFIQLIHGVKIIYPTADYTLEVLYLAHKYQVLTVLRRMKVYIKSLSDGDISSIWFFSYFPWVERVLVSKKHLDDFQRLINKRGKLDIENCNERTVCKRKIFLAITRAPFTHDLDIPEHEPLPVLSSILDNFSETVRRVTGCL